MFINNLIQATYLVFVEVNDNYESSFLLDITENDDGLTIDKEISFAESQHIINGFNFDQEHILHQIPLVVGETISLSLRHIRLDFSCIIKMNVYDPDGNLIAQGAAGTSNQSNLQARIDQIPVLINGRYSIEISPSNPTCFTGSYRLSGSIDGDSIQVEDFQTGGNVNGTLYDADGITPVIGELVNLTTTGTGPKYARQVMTDSNGGYSFSSIPLGPFILTYVPRPTVSETSELTFIGETITQDLVLSSTTILNIHVLNEDNTPISNQVRLDIQPIGGTFFRPYTNSQGEYTYTYFGVDELYISVKSPYDNQIRATQFVQPVDGQTIEVNLVLTSVNIQGNLYRNDGVTLVPNAQITAYYAHNNQNIKSIYTNAQGQFTLELPINNDIFLVVQDPSNNVYTQSPQFPVGSVDTTQDVLLDPVGTVFGMLSGVTDVPIPNAEIRARYQDQGFDYNNETSIQTTTDSSGEYSFDHIPLSQNIEIEYSEYRSSGEISVSGNTTVVNAGDSEEVNLFIGGAAISIQLSIADGLPINSECNIFLTGANDGNGGGLNNRNPLAVRGGGFYEIELWNVDCDNQFVFAGLDLSSGSEYQLIVENWSDGLGFTENYTLIPDDLLTVNHIYSVVKGLVSFFDGSIVEYAQMTINSQYSESDNLGFYRIVNVESGLVNIKAEDTATSLQKVVETQLLDKTVPLVVNIQLPASANVNGQVLDTGGLPIENITVYADSSNSTTVLQNDTDVNGNYDLSHVIAGDVEISAINQATNNVVSTHAQITTDGETQTHDLQFTQPGSVTGVLNDENSAAVSSGCVTLKYIQSGVSYQGLDLSTSSDALGQYSIDSAAAGDVMVTGLDDCNSPTQASVEQGEVISNANTTVNLQLGNAVPLTHELNQTGSNYSYEVNAKGQVQSKNKDIPYGYNRSFIDQPSLTVNGKTLNSQYAALIEDVNTELTIGPTEYNGIAFSRKTFVPESGLFIRILDSVTNNTLLAQQVTVKVSGYYGTNNFMTNPKALLTVDVATQGNHYSIHKSTIPGDEFGFPPELEYLPSTTAYVYSDNNNLFPANTGFYDGSNRFNWSWTVTLQTGETKSFLSYITAKVPTPDDTDISDSIILADELVNGTQIDMYNGLSIDEKASITNFQVPQ